MPTDLLRIGSKTLSLIKKCNLKIILKRYCNIHGLASSQS